MSPLVVARLRIAALLFVTIVVQTTVGDDLRIAHVAPDLTLLVAVSAGLVGGPDSGAVIGFFSGLLADLTLTTTPIGLTALAWCLTGWGVGALRVNYLPDSRLFQPLVGLFASGVGIVVFLIAGDLAGQHELIAPGRSWLVKVAIIEGLWNAVLIVPVTWLLGKAAQGSKGVGRLGRSDAVAL